MPKQRNPFLFRNNSGKLSQDREIARRVENLKRAPISVYNRQLNINVEKPRKPFNPTIPVAGPVGTSFEGTLLFSLFEYTPNKAYFYRIESDLSVTEISVIDDALSLFSGMFVKAGNAHYACWAESGGPERIRRSTDGCVTWGIVSGLPEINFNPPDIIEGPDGTIWASLDDDTNGDQTLWKSTDNGETWSHIHTFAIAFDSLSQVPIAVNPTNPNHLLAFGVESHPFPVADIITLGQSFNAGVSFSEEHPSSDEEDMATCYKVVGFTPSGKMVACWEDFPSTTSILRCGINSGGGWSVIEMPSGDPTDFGYSADPGMGPLQIVSEDEYLFCGNVFDSQDQFRLWRTTNGGNTWQLAINGVTGDDEGMKYYYHNGILFLANHFTPIAGGPMLLANTDPWGSGTWQTLLTRSDSDFEPAWGQAFALL